MKLANHLFVLCLCFSGFAAANTQEAPLSLTVTVFGAQENTGHIFLSLFSSEENYLKEPVRYKELPVDNDGSIIFEFKGLAPGTYAVSAIYDEDSNGKLNTGFLGIPKEPIGMSNNVKGTFGPPSFKKTSFKLNESGEIEILLGKVK